MNSTWVNGAEINNWARNYHSARFKLPQVLRRLVLGSVRTKKLNFPSDEDAERRGFDGHLQASTGNAWVPDGISVWEIGTSAKPEIKAEEDFQKRTSNCTLINRSDTTFVFVTPHKWDYEKWCAEKRGLGFWKDVRVLDSSDLAQWLDNTPAVAAWVARLLGHKPEGVCDINVHWENLSGISSPKLRPEIFLAGREKEIEAVKKWLKKKPGDLQVQSQSKNDVLDFLSAYAFHKKGEFSVQARTLFVGTKEAWRSLCACNTSMVLVPEDLEIDFQLVNEATRNGHHVLVPTPSGVSAGKEVVHLSRLPFFEISKALRKAGFSENRAKRIERDAGGHAAIFKRVVGKVTYRVPAWADPSNAAKLAGFILVGGWSDENQHDRHVVSKITGLSEAEVRSVVQQWSRCDDPLFLRKRDNWQLASRADSWKWLAGYLSQSCADAYFEVFPFVLAVDNPKYDLPASERMFAPNRKMALNHSEKLREGLTEAFALLSISEEPDSGIVASQVRLSLWKLFDAVFQDGIGWKRWASLNECLLSFAEAKPDDFLEALERDLSKESAPLAGLFEEENLFSGSSFSALMWALQVLGWEPNYLLRVSLVLARLSALDAGGKCNPRPFGVLGGYFFPLLPQTAASPERRLEILDEMIVRYPEVAWKLMYELLPRGIGTTMCNSQPRWRNWSLDWQSVVTRSEVWDQVSEMTQRIISLVAAKPERLPELLQHLAHYLATARTSIFAALDVVDAEKLDDGARELACKSLRELIHTNTRIDTAWWSLPKDQINRLSVALEKFQPVAAINRYRWYFDNYPQLPGLVRDLDEKERKALVDIARENAVQQVFQSEGLDSVIKLAEVAHESWSVGYAVGKTAELLGLKEAGILPDLVDSKNQNLRDFAVAYARARFDCDGEAWLKTLPLGAWRSEQVANLVIGLPFEPQFWDLAQSHGQATADIYWSNSRGYNRGFDINTAERAVKEWLRVSNVSSALMRLAFAVEDDHQPNVELVFLTLEAWLERSQQEPLRLESYEIHVAPKLIEYLQTSDSLENARLASLEWGLLPLIGNTQFKPQALFDWLATNPPFYVEVIEASRPYDKGESPTQQEINKGDFAKMLLEAWVLSAIAEDESFKAARLDEWINEVRDICFKHHLKKHIEYWTGLMLAHSPEGGDGVWPPIELRKMIESWQSESLESGLNAGRRNNYQPGTLRKKAAQKTWKDLIDKHKRDAVAIAGRFPRTSALLRAIAAGYQRSYDRMNAASREE